MFISKNIRIFVVIKRASDEAEIYYELVSKNGADKRLVYGDSKDFRGYLIVDSQEFIRSNTSVLDINNRIYNENK